MSDGEVVMSWHHSLAQCMAQRASTICCCNRL